LRSLPLIAFLVGGVVFTAEVVRADDAASLLAALRSRLPREPVVMTGTITVRKRHGIVVGQLGIKMTLDWGQTPTTSKYTILDAFGKPLEELRITRDAAGAVGFEYQANFPLRPAPLPNLFAPIQNSDVSWMDLALAFLWWEGGKVVGTDEVLGRPCHIVEIPAPPGLSAPPPRAAQSSAAPYAAVRLWIDAEMLMLLKAEGLSQEDNVLRRLWVRSFKRINDRWMIKDLEVQGCPSAHRTKITITDVSVGNESWTPS